MFGREGEGSGGVERGGGGVKGGGGVWESGWFYLVIGVVMGWGEKVPRLIFPRYFP